MKVAPDSVAVAFAVLQRERCCGPARSFRFFRKEQGYECSFTTDGQ